MDDRKKTFIALLAVAAVAGFSLWLRSGFPLTAIASGNADEFLFIRLAAALRRAHWLGAYDNYTLVKGIFYPAFIAVISLFHIPLKIAEHVVYLAAAMGLSVVAYRLSRSRILGVLLFAALALNPVFWAHSLARVIRDGLYIGLALGLVAALAGLWSVDGKRARTLLALLAGGLAAAFWMTREEGIWIVPALAVLVAFVAAARRFAARAAGIGFAVAAGMIVLVATIHFALYGVFTDVEFRAKGFLSAYGAFGRVKGENWQRYVVAPRDAREKVYAVSPAAATLRPALEGEIGAKWQKGGCLNQPVEPCDDILGGWFVWAMRDAAGEAGHHASGGAAEAFYARMADEVEAACVAGKLDCLASRASLQPPFRTHYLADTAAMSLRMARLLSTFGRAELMSLPSIGSPQRLAIFRDLVGPVDFPPPRAAITYFSGWVAAPDAAPAIALIDSQGNARGGIELSSGADIERALAARKLQARRFFIRPACPDLECMLVFTLANGTQRELPLAALNGVPPADPDYVFSLDDLAHDVEEIPEPTRQRIAPIQSVARAIADAYALLSLPLFGMGCLGLIAALWVFRRAPPLLFLTGIGAAAAAAVVTRVALLSYLEVTTFPALNILYLSATPFVIVTAVLGTWLGVRALMAR